VAPYFVFVLPSQAEYTQKHMKVRRRHRKHVADDISYFIRTIKAKRGLFYVMQHKNMQPFGVSAYERHQQSSKTNKLLLTHLEINKSAERSNSMSYACSELLSDYN